MSYCEPRSGKTALSRTLKEAKKMSIDCNTRVIVRYNTFREGCPAEYIGYWYTIGKCSGIQDCGDIHSIFENGNQKFIGG